MNNFFRNGVAKRLRTGHTLVAMAALLTLAFLTIGRGNWPRNPKNTATVHVNTGTLWAPFSFTDQRGASVDSRSLRGHVWLADFMYTTCTGACPLITSRFVTLQRRLADERLRFVSFSVDPERDTTTALADYAARWAPGESRWLLLRTNPAGLAPLLAGLQLALAREQGELIHTSRLFLVGAEGAVVASYDSADDTALDQLVSRARELLGSPRGAGAESGLSGSGADLYASLGCAGCHADAQLAPPLGGLAGRPVMLEQAGSVLATDAYLAESIAAPATKLVAGYPNSMPNYGPLLAPAQVQSLVTYVRSFAPQPLSGSIGAQIDPVCGMFVRFTRQTPSVEYQGKTHRFCSPACAQRFKRDPQRYLTGKPAAAP